MTSDWGQTRERAEEQLHRGESTAHHGAGEATERAYGAAEQFREEAHKAVDEQGGNGRAHSMIDRATDTSERVLGTVSQGAQKAIGTAGTTARKALQGGEQGAGMMRKTAMAGVGLGAAVIGGLFLWKQFSASRSKSRAHRARARAASLGHGAQQIGAGAKEIARATRGRMRR